MPVLCPTCLGNRSYLMYYNCAILDPADIIQARTSAENKVEYYVHYHGCKLSCLISIVLTWSYVFYKENVHKKMMLKWPKFEKTMRLKPSAHSTIFVTEDQDFCHWR